MTKAINTMFIGPFSELDMQEIVGEAIEEKQEEIFDVNRDQLARGLDAKGKSLGRYKNFKYKNRFQPVDLLLTGSFQGKMTLTPGKKSAELFSQDQKAPFLEKRYGKDILGISGQGKDRVMDIISSPIGRLIKKKLFGQ